MSCEGCIAERMSIIASYNSAKKEAIGKANASNQIYFILKTDTGYTISDKIEPNAIETIFPDR